MRLSHQSFIENTFEFVLKSLTYNLFKYFNGLRGKDRKITVMENGLSKSSSALNMEEKYLSKYRVVLKFDGKGLGGI